MHTRILQMSCSTSKFGVLYCLFLQKQRKLEGTCLNSFNWLIHEQLVDLKACTLQMGQDTKVNPLVLTVVPRLAIDLIFKSKIRWHSSWRIWKDSKGPDVNQYIRSCAMYFFGICLFLLPFFCSISCIHPWLCLEAIRQDVCLTQWCWGWIPSFIFTANWSGPWAVWLAWSFDPGPKWFWKFHFWEVISIQVSKTELSKEPSALSESLLNSCRLSEA